MTQKENLVQNEPEQVVVVEGTPIVDTNVVGSSNYNTVPTVAAPPPKATVVAVPNPVQRHPPPPGVEPGGVWGRMRYIGSTSGAVACIGCLCLGIPALLVLLCPLDERDAYKVNGRIYDPEGKYIGSATHKFKATMERN